MTEFNHVTLIKKANIYFDGKVTSRTVVFPAGSRKTLGIMLPGEYEFNTDAPEIMDIISGDLDVLLPGWQQWKKVEAENPLKCRPNPGSGSGSGKLPIIAAHLWYDRLKRVGL